VNQKKILIIAGPNGGTYIKMIRAWRKKGYQIKLIYLSLASSEEAVARVKARVRQG
jgi:predicted ABC-type ATPase